MPNFQLWRRRLYTAAKREKKGIPNPRFDTSDVAQEALVRLLKGAGGPLQEDGETVLSEALLATAGRNMAKNMLRDNLAAKRSMDCEDPGATGVEPSGREEDPIQLAAHREDIVLLINAIGRLDARRQFIVFRRFFDGKTWNEIAEDLGTTLDIVRADCDRAIVALRRILRAPHRMAQ